MMMVVVVMVMMRTTVVSRISANAATAPLDRIIAAAAAGC